MAFGNFGVSFLPGADGGPQDQNGFNGGASGVPPLQQAIKFLSLRLPRFAGPNAIAPPTLLNAAGAAGGLPPWLASMVGQQGQRGPGGGGMAPPPRVGPGVQEGPMPPRRPPGAPPEMPMPGPTPVGHASPRMPRQDFPLPPGDFADVPAAPPMGAPTGGGFSQIGGMSPDALLAAWDRVRRGGYQGPGGI